MSMAVYLYLSESTVRRIISDHDIMTTHSIYQHLQVIESVIKMYMEENKI